MNRGTVGKLRPGITMRVVLLAFITCAASSFAGEIYGTIKENGKPVGKGIAVSITPGTASAAETDEFGGYRILVPQVGPCTVNVSFNGKTISCPIQSYTKPTRFDLVVENANGEYTLRRQ
jgi:hypothetical protein